MGIYKYWITANEYLAVGTNAEQQIVTSEPRFTLVQDEQAIQRLIDSWRADATARYVGLGDIRVGKL